MEKNTADKPSPSSDPTSEDGPSSFRRKLGEVDDSFYIIGVGASAGGLEAIKHLISQVPEDFQHSFVIIQHLSPDYKSLMAEILSRETPLRVQEVEDDMKVEPGNIYLIPPRSNVVIQGTVDDTNTDPPDAGTDPSFGGLRFSLVEQTPRHELNLPIDVFFHSLAEAVGHRSVGIILSGTGSDGSRGLRAIKDRDGFVIVQDPDNAGFDGMPRSAIATRIIDLVTTPDAMVGEFSRFIEMRKQGILNVNTLFDGATEEFEKLLKLVSETAEIDFSQYKEPTLMRRIARRMVLCDCESVAKYLEFVQKSPTEASTLYREFLVGVTNFFRDRPSWRSLEEEVIPKLFEDTDSDEPVKVWSIGCSTGEEAFSIALLLESYRRKHRITRDFKVFATDVNKNAIAVAREATYSESALEEIPSSMIDNDLVSYLDGSFRFSYSLRKRVIFAEHNVIMDSPYIRTNLVICRNLLIYLSPEMQSTVLSLVSFSLMEGGFVFLGAAEHVPRQNPGFEAINPNARLFRNTRRSRPKFLSQFGDHQFPTPSSFVPRMRTQIPRKARVQNSPAEDLFREVLDQLDACAVIVDRSGFVRATFGNYRTYFQMPDDSFSADLSDLLGEPLRSAVVMALRRSERDEPHRQNEIPVTIGEETRLVDMHCRPTNWDGQRDAFVITLRRTAISTPAERDRGERAETGEIDSGYLTQLENEVETLQEMLSVTSEELGVANEELQTANEELVASNEELQAGNEEMQSINEELHTVNAENQQKISELEAANDDIENLLDNAELSVLFLDNDLRIRRFSRGFSNYVDLASGDIARPISIFNSTLEADGFAKLMDDADRARNTGEETSRELRTRSGGWAYCRVRPFMAKFGGGEGVVIKLIDLTDLKLLQEEVRLQRDRLEGILESEAAGYWDWNIPENTEFMSPRFKEMLGYKDRELANVPETWQRLIHKDDLPVMMEQFKAHVESRGEVPYNSEVRYHHKDGSLVWVICRGHVVEWTTDGAPVRMVGVHMDITSLKERETEVRRRAEEIRRFAFIAAHDLVQPATTIENGITALAEDHGDQLDEDGVELIDFLTTGIGRIKTRIRGVLEYSRLLDGKLEFTEVDVGKIAQNCIDDLQAQIEDSCAEIDVGELPRAMGSPELIARVIQNLLSNSVKYCHTDRPCVVRIEEVKAPAGMVAIRVSDNGIGIPEKYRKKVFELFSRLHTDAEYEGTGLGLALCERLVAQHGGRIWVEDGLDGGSAFIFTLKAPE